MATDKAPSPNGFTNLFHQTAWSVIKEDILRAFNALWTLYFRTFYLVNQAYMILLRKWKEADGVKDYRPVSLIHIFSKLVSKTLALRLVPHMNKLVQPNQRAFIKGCVIHDNLRVVQSTTKMLHARKRSSALVKIDIVKAFDTVGWA
jgi:hypothetical protein